MLEGIGLGLAGPSFFTACFSPGGQSAVAARPDPAKPHSASLEWVEWVKPSLEWVEPSDHAALNTAPSGTTPWVVYRHKATRSLRASATMAIRRIRPFAAPTLA